MKTAFWIDGGAGRVIASIPAFLKYKRLNPDDNFAIIAGMDFLFWGTELQDHAYNIDTKGVFDNVIKNVDNFITPEPYRIPDYFNQKISIAEGFDRIINNTKDHTDLGLPVLKTNIKEKEIADVTLGELKKKQKNAKVIVVQPFGRGAVINNNKIYDEESRSMSPTNYLKLVKKLNQKYNTIFFGEPQFQLTDDTFSGKYTTDLRQWIALIEAADYFIGCDSVGQHIAVSVGTPGTVIFGSTFPVNTSYPSYFNIVESKKSKKYSPVRVAGLDSLLSNRVNEGCMEFNEEELNEIVDKVTSEIEKRK